MKKVIAICMLALMMVAMFTPCTNHTVSNDDVINVCEDLRPNPHPYDNPMV